MLSGGGMNFSLRVAKTMHWNLAHAARAQRLTQAPPQRLRIKNENRCSTGPNRLGDMAGCNLLSSRALLGPVFFTKPLLLLPTD